jgi:hypothetical protein
MVTATNNPQRPRSVHIVGIIPFSSHEEFRHRLNAALPNRFHSVPDGESPIDYRSLALHWMESIRWQRDISYATLRCCICTQEILISLGKRNTYFSLGSIVLNPTGLDEAVRNSTLDSALCRKVSYDQKRVFKRLYQRLLTPT